MFETFGANVTLPIWVIAVSVILAAGIAYKIGRNEGRYAEMRFQREEREKKEKERKRRQILDTQENIANRIANAVYGAILSKHWGGQLLRVQQTFEDDEQRVSIFEYGSDGKKLTCQRLISIGFSDRVNGGVFQGEDQSYRTIEFFDATRESEIVRIIDQTLDFIRDWKPKEFIPPKYPVVR